MERERKRKKRKKRNRKYVYKETRVSQILNKNSYTAATGGDVFRRCQIDIFICIWPNSSTPQGDR